MRLVDIGEEGKTTTTIFPTLIRYYQIQEYCQSLESDKFSVMLIPALSVKQKCLYKPHGAGKAGEGSLRSLLRLRAHLGFSLSLAQKMVVNPLFGIVPVCFLRFPVREDANAVPNAFFV